MILLKDEHMIDLTGIQLTYSPVFRLSNGGSTANSRYFDQEDKMYMITHKDNAHVVVGSPRLSCPIKGEYNLLNTINAFATIGYKPAIYYLRTHKLNAIL